MYALFQPIQKNEREGRQTNLRKWCLSRWLDILSVSEWEADPGNTKTRDPWDWKERQGKQSLSHVLWERKRVISSRKSFLATVIFSSDRCSWWETSRKSCREWKESRKEPSTTTMIMMMMIPTSVTGKARRRSYTSSAGRILWSVCGDYHLNHKHIFSLSLPLLFLCLSSISLSPSPEVTLISIQSFLCVRVRSNSC